MPGIAEKDIEVKVANGGLTIRGEKHEEKEEKFAVPEGVDTGKIEASFRKGLLMVRLPKKPEAVKPEKKIEVKAAA